MKIFMSKNEIKINCLEILLCFDEFCTRHNLTYSLTYGTLLGAVRHKGFIPWDDDIDVAMPRSDYDIFRKLFNSKNQNKKYFFRCGDNGDLELPFGKILDITTKLDIQNNYATNGDHLSVDVFPFDEIPKFTYLRSFIFYTVVLLNTLLGFSKESRQKIGKKGKFAFIIKRLANIFFATKFKRNILVRVLTFLSKLTKYNKSNYVAPISWIHFYGTKDKILREGFLKRIKLIFEGHEFFVMSGYHEYLSSIYGDYMKLPPIEKRINHGFKAYYLKNQKD